MAALGKAGTYSEFPAVESAGSKSLMLGSAAALVGIGTGPNRKRRRAAAATARRKANPGTKPKQ